MVVNTRRRLAQQREERPKPCRPTVDSIDSDSETHSEDSSSRPGNDKTTTTTTDKKGNREIDLSWFDKARLRVIAAAVFGFRCLLTLEPGLTNKDLNFVHFLAKTTSVVILSYLEHAWGLYPGHLNVNHYLNIDIMRMDLHHSFDAGVFFFLPTVAALTKILEFTEFNACKTRTRDKKRFYEEFKDTTWSYHFYTVAFDQHRSIHRRRIDTSVRIPDITRHPDVGGYTEHSFPFNHSDMKNIESHVNPFFVVANAFIHLSKLANTQREKMMIEHEDGSLELIWRIGQIWFKPAPASFKDTRKGGANAMADPIRDTESFLADKDSHGKVKYQKKEVFYRKLMVWADHQRSMENVFLKKEVEVPRISQQPLHEPRRRTRSSTVSLKSKDDDLVMEEFTETRSSKRKRRGDHHSEGPIEKKGKVSSYPYPYPSLPTTRTRGKRTDVSAVKSTDLSPAISSYPTSLEPETEDGTDLLLDFISSQIKMLCQNSGKKVPLEESSFTIDNQKVADIAFSVLENQSTNPNGEDACSIVGADSVSKTVVSVGPHRRVKPMSTPAKKSISQALTPRPITTTLAHVEMPIKSARGKSVPPSSRPKPVSTRVSVVIPRSGSVAPATRALSTPPASKPSLSKLSTMFPKKSASLARIEKLEFKSIKRDRSPPIMKNSSSSPDFTLEPPPPQPALDVDTSDGSVFLHAGQLAVFASLSGEFGITVAEVSSVYDEVRDLDKTRRILAKLSQHLGPSSDCHLSTETPYPVSSKVMKPQASSSSSAPRKPSSSRSQSVGPLVPMTSFTPPSTPIRLFLKEKEKEKKKKKKKGVRESSRYSPDISNDASSADEAPPPPLPPPSWNLWSPRRTPKVKRLGTNKSENSSLAAVGWTRTPEENRLDSLTRSIEMILQTGIN